MQGAEMQTTSPDQIDPRFQPLSRLNNNLRADEIRDALKYFDARGAFPPGIKVPGDFTASGFMMLPSAHPRPIATA